LETSGWRAVILIDGLDEGWRPEDLEAGIIGGLCTTAVDLRDRTTNIHVLVFIRDNMFRLLSGLDSDFSRNMAGDNIRLTWDHSTLFDLVARRLRAINGWPVTLSSVEAWNRFASDSLQGEDGFRECLRHTLYRPRDVLELLNRASVRAERKGHGGIVAEDVLDGAKDISDLRLQDLVNEYEEVMPGLKSYVAAFSGRSAIDTFGSIISLFQTIRPKLPVPAQRTFARLGTPSNVFQSLFGVGFIGVEVSSSGFQFCHDGADVSGAEPKADTKIAVHPCYSRALDVTLPEGTSFDVLLPMLQDVNDDYDEEPGNQEGVRHLLVDGFEKLVRDLADIPTGHNGAHRFEEWVHNVITLLFSGSLSDIELHPDTKGTLRRDVVGANVAARGLWKRLASTYRASHVVFEVKNFERLEPDAYAQARAYQGAIYGNLAFIIYRSKRDTLDANEKSHLQTHWGQGALIVLVPAHTILLRCLQKQRHNDRPDYTARAFTKWVHRHERTYVNPVAGRHGVDNS